jgi:N-acyl-D-amino-acid deacylase
VPDTNERFVSRVVFKSRDVLKSFLPAKLQDWIREYQGSQMLGDSDASDMWTSPPADRLAIFTQQMRELIVTAKATGARVAVATHANAFHKQAELDASLLQSWQKFYPRAKDQVLIEFDAAANQIVRDLAKEYNVELIDIAERSGAKAEIYHLKAAGEANWRKLPQAIALVERARARGLAVTANIYPYTAAATGLDAVMPPWVQLGGIKPWVERLRDPAIRARVIKEMRDPAPDWENLLLDGAERAQLLAVRNRKLNDYVGMTLAEIANKRGVSAEDAAIDLVIADGSRLSVAYTLMSGANLQKKLRLDWVSIGSDASAPSAEGGFLYRNQHPRAYGSFARVLGRYVRELNTLELEDAVYRMTGLPADNLRLVDRGKLVPGYFADLAIFDAATISDHSTFEDSHRYATGMRHVFVNGKQAIANGRPTGALAGQTVRGPGFVSSD